MLHDLSTPRYQRGATNSISDIAGRIRFYALAAFPNIRLKIRAPRNGTTNQGVGRACDSAKDKITMTIQDELINTTVKLLSGGVIVIGITNALAYCLLDRDLWETLSPGGILMALPTAIALIMTGICSLLLSIRKTNE